MKILLDTHIFLWALTDDVRLSEAQREAYLSEHSELYLSHASLWEILIKTRLGRLSLPEPTMAYVIRQMEKNRVSPLSIQLAHLANLESLPNVHRDPFDRMLIAQARAEKMAILTSDALIRQYDVESL